MNRLARARHSFGGFSEIGPLRGCDSANIVTSANFDILSSFALMTISRDIFDRFKGNVGSDLTELDCCCRHYFRPVFCHNDRAHSEKSKNKSSEGRNTERRF